MDYALFAPPPTSRRKGVLTCRGERHNYGQSWYSIIISWYIASAYEAKLLSVLFLYRYRQLISISHRVINPFFLINDFSHWPIHWFVWSMKTLFHRFVWKLFDLLFTVARWHATPLCPHSTYSLHTTFRLMTVVASISFDGAKVGFKLEITLDLR